MKKRPSSSTSHPVRSVGDTKSAAGKKAAPVASATPRPVHRLHPTKRDEESAALEVITIPPTGSDEPPVSTAQESLKRVRFGYFQPDAKEVFVAGSFNNWNPRATPMKRDSIGDWSVEVRLPPGEYRYRLLVDGEWRDDPSAQLTAMNSYGAFDAVVVV